MKNRKQVTVYRVKVGSFSRDYSTRYHAEQMQRALRLHPALADMAITIIAIRLPDDPLTRLTVSA